jgi:vacuolar-type H+-ATPase subunit H
MQEIVNKVLEAEQQAENAVQEARAKAAELRSQADTESEGKLLEAREQAHSLLHGSLLKAREQAAQEQQKARQQAERDNERFLEERRQAIDGAAEAVVRLLIAPEYARAQEPERPGK